MWMKFSVAAIWLVMLTLDSGQGLICARSCQNRIQLLSVLDCLCSGTYLRGSSTSSGISKILKYFNLQSNFQEIWTVCYLKGGGGDCWIKLDIRSLLRSRRCFTHSTGPRTQVQFMERLQFNCCVSTLTLTACTQSFGPTESTDTQMEKTFLMN